VGQFLSVGWVNFRAARPQVGRQRDELYASSSDIYEKWSQALASAYDLINSAANDEEGCSAVFPLLVVPEGRLWRAEFDQNGSLTGNPRQVDRCSYFVGKRYWAGDNLSGFPYYLSHLEFITLPGLRTFTSSTERIFSQP